MNTPVDNSTPSPNAEIEAESSLVFLTHPTVTSQLKKWIGFDLEEIQLAKTRAPVWTKELGFNKDTITRDTYILVFGGDFQEELLNPRLVAAKWDASIAKVQRPGKAKEAAAAPTRALYKERDAAAVPNEVNIGNTYVPSKKAYNTVHGSKHVGNIKIVEAKKNGDVVYTAYAKTPKGERVYVEKSAEEAADSARGDLKEQIVQELVKTSKSIDQKLYELRKGRATQDEISAWLKKRQQVNEVLAVYSY